jgi:serine/threonine-protein kinase
VTRRGPALAARVFLGTAAIVCAVVAAALAATSLAARGAAARDERRALEQAADLTAQLLAGRARALAGGTRVFVQGPYFRALVAGARRDDILDQAFEAAGQLEAAWVFVTDERGVLLAKSDEPAASGAPMGDIPLVRGALEGRTTSGFGASRDTLLFQAVCVPIVVPGGAPVGTLTATRVIDAAFARDVRAATGADVVFYTAGAGGRRVVATSLGRGRAQSLLADSAGALVQQSSLVTAGGEVVGGFLVLHAAPATPPGLAGVRLSLLVAGALGLACALGAAWAAALHVTRPARRLADAARAAVQGDYAAADRAARAAAGPARPGTARDEIGDLAAALAALLAELREKEVLVSVLGAAPAGVAARDDDEPEGARPPRARARTPVVPLPRAAGAARAAPRPGEVVAGRYAVLAELGRGGAGVVLLARDGLVGERVALKVLRPEAWADDAEAFEQLAREMRLARRVSHRNVVRTHDLGHYAGTPFITMEYVDGASLRALLRARGALGAPGALALARQLARALEAAHEQGVVHGDVKPENLLVRRDGLLKVTDFGVASVARRGAPGGRPADRRLAGAILGSPEYLAPEVLLGARPDPRADLYAMGVVVQECLTGGTPYQVDTPGAFLARKLADAGPSAAPAAAPAPPSPDAAHLAALAAQLTAADREARPRGAAAVVAALERLAG